MTLLLLSISMGYVLGSIPSAVWLGRAFYGIDVREHGSGNPGATNTFRVLGKGPGVVVLLLDVLKGTLAALVPTFLSLETQVEISHSGLVVMHGLAAVVGHLFPVFLWFKGGKGVATLLGMVLVLHPEAAGCCVLLFVFLLLLTHYVSLSAMVSTLAFALLATWVPYFLRPDPWIISFAWAVFILLLFTHRKNIVNLLKGRENKIYLWK
jgi:acyl phosphate:glycerol-3-phosphate acyltransferase